MGINSYINGSISFDYVWKYSLYYIVFWGNYNIYYSYINNGDFIYINETNSQNFLLSKNYIFSDLPTCFIYIYENIKYLACLYYNYKYNINLITIVDTWTNTIISDWKI